MTTKKITKRDRFNTLLTFAEVQNNADIKAFIEHEIELLNKKSASGEKKVNEKMATAKATVLEFLGTVDKAAVSDVKTLLNAENPQFPTAVLTQLRGEGKVVREVIKGKSFYSLA